jgi:hypothetical protein
LARRVAAVDGGAVPGLLDADQVGGQDCWTPIAFLELGIDEPDAFKIGSGDDAKANVVEFGRQAGLQIDLGPLVDDRRDHIVAGEHGCPLLRLERFSSTGGPRGGRLQRLVREAARLLEAAGDARGAGRIERALRGG